MAIFWVVVHLSQGHLLQWIYVWRIQGDTESSAIGHLLSCLIGAAVSWANWCCSKRHRNKPIMLQSTLCWSIYFQKFGFGRSLFNVELVNRTSLSNDFIKHGWKWSISLITYREENKKKKLVIFSRFHCQQFSQKDPILISIIYVSKHDISSPSVPETSIVVQIFPPVCWETTEPLLIHRQEVTK